MSGAYAACRLGPHMPAPGAVVTFTAADAAAHQRGGCGGGGGDDDGEEWGDAAALLVRLPEADCAAMAALRGAATRLQQRLLRDPPPLRHGVTSLTLTCSFAARRTNDDFLLGFRRQQGLAVHLPHLILPARAAVSMGFVPEPRCLKRHFVCTLAETCWN